MKPYTVSSPVASIDHTIQKQAESHQSNLTKPLGSLGKLETLAIKFAAWQGHIKPSLNATHISIFAADHGIADEAVSAFPQAVTAEMVKNFARGGAAISVLANNLGAHFEIIDTGVKDFSIDDKQIISARVGNATTNFSKQAAMTKDQLDLALQVGFDAAERAKQAGCFIGGEMGIANTTAATAMSCLLLDKSPQELAGAGTGLDEQGIQHKITVIETALALHKPHIESPLDILQTVGGFEIAALVGAYIRCAQLGLPILVDGFITSAAALQAVHINPDVRNWMLFSHTSAEQGHHLILDALEADPILNLGMRLGEGSGAAMAIPIIQQALSLHNNMATFAEAGVSEKS